MIGVFDSGLGGTMAARELEVLLPEEDICFFADRLGAPYGTKDEGTLLSLVMRDIRLLEDEGADRILMACCTASTVHHLLPPEYRSRCVPIIEPTARRALSLTRCGRIGVIATERTVGSGAFERALRGMRGELEVTSVAAQPLVALIEGGERDGNVSVGTVAYIRALLSPLLEARVDTLILGCTHFPHLARTVASLAEGVALVSSAREGALEMKKRAPTAPSRGIRKYITERKGHIKWQNTDAAESTMP